MTHHVTHYDTSCDSSLLFVKWLIMMAPTMHYGSWLIVTHPGDYPSDSCDSPWLMWFFLTHPGDSSCDTRHDSSCDWSRWSMWLIMTHGSLCDSSQWLIMWFTMTHHVTRYDSFWWLIIWHTPWLILVTHHKSADSPCNSCSWYDELTSLPVPSLPLASLPLYQFPVSHLQVYQFLGW